ncbi:hypothetical protein [Streptomyces sp. NPDC097610]
MNRQCEIDKAAVPATFGDASSVRGTITGTEAGNPTTTPVTR